jgi:hypothetical protein
VLRRGRHRIRMRRRALHMCDTRSYQRASATRKQNHASRATWAKSPSRHYIGRFFVFGPYQETNTFIYTPF